MGAATGGHATGLGELRMAAGDSYVGWLRDGKPWGHGRLETPDGTVYEGELWPLKYSSTVVHLSP